MSKENKKQKIFRVEKDKSYCTIKNDVFLDSRISWGAKGVLGYALTKPDDWDLYISEVTKNGIDKIDKVTKYFKELRLAGYIEYVVIREKGKIIKTEYLIYEKPLHNNPVSFKTTYQKRKERELKKLSLEPNLDNPRQEKPETAFQVQEKQPLLNTDYLLNTDNNKILSDTLPETPLQEKQKEPFTQLTTSNLIEIKNRLSKINASFGFTYIESSKANQLLDKAIKDFSGDFLTFFNGILDKLDRLTAKKLDTYQFNRSFTIESLTQFNCKDCSKIEAWYNKEFGVSKSSNVVQLPKSKEPIRPTFDEKNVEEFMRSFK